MTLEIVKNAQKIFQIIPLNTYFATKKSKSPQLVSDTGLGQGMRCNETPKLKVSK